MKGYNTISYNKNAVDWLLFLLRLFVGLAIMTHGLPKLLNFISGEVKFMDFMGFGSKTSLFLVIFAEIVCAFLLLLGLFTRWATIPLIITMLVAAFMAHRAEPFSDREMSLLYLFHFFTILVLGPGRFSVDRMISRR